MMMTTAAVELSSSLQALVDSRLDTIDRMLMGRVPRQDRLAIVREVEVQVFELLQERGREELTREAVLAVLARLDPPEAYLPEATGDIEPVSTRRPSGPRAVHPLRKGDPKVARLSGILGLVVLALVLLIPVEWMIAYFFDSSALIVTLWLGSIFLVLVGGIVAITMGIFSRIGSVWAVVGIVTGIFSMLIAILGGIFLILDMRGS
jgi:hypothetical protein